MNKKKRFMLTVILFSIYLFLPIQGLAQYDSAKAIEACGKVDSSWTKACKNKYKITITAGDYIRDSGYKNGLYTNDVQSRKITIKGNENATYKIRVFMANVGEIEKLNKDNFQAIIDDDTEDEQNITLKKKKMTNGSYEFDLPAGKEALVIAYLAAKSDSGKTCVTESNTTETVYCEKGAFEAKNGTEVELTGNSASLFVQNPSDSGLVLNLRYRGNNSGFGQACSNAYDGKYVNENGEINEEESVKSGWLGTWREKFYDKVLGETYCDKEYVAFNLNENQINKISRKLLDVFNSYIKLEENKYKIEDIEKDINYYRDNNIGQILEQEKNQSPNISDLTCDYTTNTKGEKSYLYVTKKENIKTEELSDGESYSVCTIQCYENLTITYGPPVAVKAGLCFEHKVTVKSETKCGVDKDTEYLNALKNKDACAPVPICSNKSSHTQAGPIEEFDNCIKECDNGKYSQKCINKCYKKVYGNNKDEEEINDSENLVKKTSKTNNKLLVNSLENKIVNTTNNNSVLKMAFDITDENKLKNYYKENNNKSCNTESLKNSNSQKIGECAEYFFYAKMLFPYGKYVDNGTKWKSCDGDDNSLCNSVSITNDGSKSKDIVNIPMQIARSSPFYLRSKEATEQLLIDLLGKNSRGRKYNINQEGVKVQYNNSYICNEECSYTGCDSDDSFTAYQFTQSILGKDDSTAEDDLTKIKKALDSCVLTSACETDPTITNFNITVNNNRKKERVQTTTKSGDTKKGFSTGFNESTKTQINQEDENICNENSSMFVPANEDQNTTTGILGLCFEGKSIRELPHYQTTITIPGSWINLKTGAVTYCKQKANKYLAKENEYCTTMDSTDVNEKWWNWVISNNSDSNLYPQDFQPEYNIKANATNFGKYNWTINYSCFYAVYNKVPQLIPNDPDVPPTKTTINNHNFKIIDNSEILVAQTENNNVGFNWTKKAQITSILKNANSTESAKTYAINPEKYKEYVQRIGDSVYEGINYEYRFHLSKENLKEIKSYNRKNTYTEYNGTFYYDKTGVPGLTTYYSDIIGDTKYVTLKSSNRDAIIGKNNDYGAELGGLLLNE